MSDTEITLRHLSEKLDQIHDCVDKNSADIVQLKTEMSYGKGAVKTVFWIGSVIAILVGLTKIL